MINLYIKMFTIMLSVLYISDSLALDIPSYINDPQNVTENIDIIIKENTPIRSNSEIASDWTEKTRKQLAQSATQLYAEAVATRAKMVGTLPAPTSSLDGVPLPPVAQKILGEVSALKSKLSALSKDNNSILQNEVKDNLKNIALSVNQIAILEGGINYLEGLQVINNIAMSLENEEKGADDEIEEE